MSDSELQPAFSLPIVNAPGKSITTFVIDYKPGETFPPHSHGSAYVIIHILSGEMRSQLEGEPEKIFKAGEHFVEVPGSHHLIVENASKEQPVKFMAVMIHDTGDKDILK